MGAGRGTLVGCRLGSSVGWGSHVVGANVGVGCIDGDTDGDDVGFTDGLEEVGSPLVSGNGMADGKGTGICVGTGTGT